MNLMIGLIEMNTLQIIYKDFVRCQVVGLTVDDRNKAYYHFSQFVPTARYTPKYKMGIWDGYIRYFSLTGLFYINLLDELFSILDMSKYEVEEIYQTNIDERDFLFEEIDDKFLSDKKWWDGHRLAGQPVEIYQHQVDIVNSCLNNPRALIEAATGAGKTLISMILAMKVSEYGRFLIIEPSKDLTIQTAETFRRLGVDCGICGCGMRELDKQITICTWQTINSLERRGKDKSLSLDKAKLSRDELTKLLNGTVGLLFDEAHNCKSNEISKMCEETFKNIPIRWGLTGTIPKAKSEQYSLYTGLGNVVHKLGSKHLQDIGVLAKCDITCIKMIDDATFKFYADEMEYLSSNKDRLKFIGNLVHNITQSKGNTLVLVQRISCGEILEEIIKGLGSDCVFLDGSVNSKNRFKEYDSIKSTNNKCIIATSAIASTGLDIPRLFNLVLLDYSKSFVRNIQSIGRGLRLGVDKDHCDIFDVFSTTGFSKKHFNERVRYYKDKEFNFKVLEVDKWK